MWLFIQKFWKKKIVYNQHFAHTSLSTCSCFSSPFTPWCCCREKRYVVQMNAMKKAPYWLVHELWRVPFPCNVPFLTTWGNVLPRPTWVCLNSSALCLSSLPSNFLKGLRPPLARSMLNDFFASRGECLPTCHTSCATLTFPN